MHIGRGMVVLGLLACLTPRLAGQEKSVAASVHALELKWTESYKQHNIDILSLLLAEDFVITVEDGSVYSKAGYISHTADSKVKVDIAEISDLKVRVHGDTAIVTDTLPREGRLQFQALRISRSPH